MSMVTATAIVGFTACGDEHDHVDADNNGKCDICETDMTPADGGNQDITVAVEKVELNKNSITLDIGGEETLTATVTPDNADNKTVTWSSDKPDIATVVGGKITAKAAGTATITATAGGKTATCSVTVNEPAPKPDVTKEEWAEILESVDNFTLTESTESKTSIQKVDGDKIGLADGSILVKDGEKYYEYRQDVETEKWAKVEISAQFYEATANVFSGFVSGIKDLYEEFDLNDGVYVAKHAVNMAGIGELHNLEVKFNHGKLTGITFQTIIEIGGDVIIEGTPAEQADEPTESGGATTETPNPTENLLITSYEVSDVGTTVVPLPKIDGGETPDPEDKAAVTADEWAEIFNGLTNVTVEMKLEGELQSTLKTDGVKVHLISADNETIFAESEGSYYKYEKTDGKWSKEEITQEAYASELEEDNAYLAVLKSLNAYYSEFDYKDGKYSVAEIEDVVIKNIEVTFDDGKLVSVKCEVEELELSYGNANATTIEVPMVNEVPNITMWTEVTDAINGEVHENDADFIWHHIFFNDAVAKQYNFDSYEATVKLDGVDGEVVTSIAFNENDIKAHTYHMQIRIKGNRYQTAEFTITFKNGDDVVATGTYTREGSKEVVLNKAVATILVEATETISITSINGSTDWNGKKITWSIDNESLATIVDNEDGTCTVTGVAEGEVILTCTVGEGKEAFSQTCEITVSESNEPTEPEDVSSQVVHNNKFPHGDRKGVQIYYDLQGSDYSKLVKQIVPANTVITATKNGEAYTVQVLRKEWESNTTNKLWIQISVDGDWSDNDYVFSISFRDADGNEVAYGTYSEMATDAALYISKDTLSLTLKEDETVTGTITASKTAAAVGDIEWKIEDTEGEGVASIEVSEDKLSVTVTALTAGTATITVTVGGLTKTCEVTVHAVGGGGVQLPDIQLKFTAVLNDYYPAAGAIYHDFISLAEIYDNFVYSLDNIQVSATLNGEEIAVELQPNGSLGGDKNMHFHAKIGDASTTVDEIKSGLSITMIFIDKDGNPCAYAIIAN